MLYTDVKYSIGDTRMDAERMIRRVDFGSKEQEIQEKYDELSLDDKEMINEMLDCLTEGNDNWGYNLKMVLQKLMIAPTDEKGRKIREEQVTHKILGEKLLDISNGYWDKRVSKIWNTFLEKYAEQTSQDLDDVESFFGSLAYTIVEDRAADAYRYPSFKKETIILTDEMIAELKKRFTENKELFSEIENKFEKLFALRHQKDASKKDIKKLEKSMAYEYLKPFFDTVPKYELIKTFCECCGVSMELIQNGIGKVYEINDLYYKQLIESLLDDEDYFNEYRDERSAYTVTKVAKAYEEYLKEDDALKEGQPVLLTRWGVINSSGKYLMLKSQKTSTHQSKSAQDAVKVVIEYLYANTH